MSINACVVCRSCRVVSYVCVSTLTSTLAPSMFLVNHSAGEHLGQRETKMPCPLFRVSRVSEQAGQVGRPVPGRRVVECSLLAFCPADVLLLLLLLPLAVLSLACCELYIAESADGCCVRQTGEGIGAQRKS